MSQLFVFIIIINSEILFVAFLFQGNFSQDVSMVRRSCTLSKISYTKSFSLTSNCALRFSPTQQSGARSIGFRKLTCKAAAENVSFEIWDFFFFLQNNCRCLYEKLKDMTWVIIINNNILSISITISFLKLETKSE